jgi:hypothetical protein
VPSSVANPCRVNNGVPAASRPPVHARYPVEASAPVRDHCLADEFMLGVKLQSWTFDGEEPPWVGDALERMGAPIGERDA